MNYLAAINFSSLHTHIYLSVIPSRRPRGIPEDKRSGPLE